MSSELRLKKLRGSGGYVMANVDDQQQMKGNLGGPDLFLAPIGRLDKEKISKFFCNTCEKEFEGPPKIEFENPNEEVAENLLLIEKGQYLCSSCNSTIAEYREFKKTDESEEIGAAKPMEGYSQQTETTPEISPPLQISEISPEAPTIEPMSESKPSEVSSIEGLSVYDENAKMIGKAKQVGIDSTQSMVLVISKNDGTTLTIPWNKVTKVGEVILLGASNTPPQENSQTGKCPNCGFSNKEGSKFCEQCGSKL